MSLDPKKALLASALSLGAFTAFAATFDQGASAGAAVSGALSAAPDAAVASVLVYDNATPFRSGVSGATPNSTSSTPNTFMGTSITLAPGTTGITGFDLFPVNNSGSAITNMKINVFVWGSVNTGTVNAASPAFSNLLGSYNATMTPNLSNGFYMAIEGTTPGVTPGFSLPGTLALTGTTIGLTFNYQLSTDGGATYVSANNLSSIIAAGASPVVGSAAFGNGYYRNGAGETTGNFASGLRTFSAATQAVAVRVYGEVSPVPEPSTYLMMGLGLALLAFTRRPRKQD